MKANKFRSKYMLILLSVTAFLAMQWSATHIHLSEKHNHDGTHHQHHVEVHSHRLTNSYVAPIDIFHQASHAHVIELDPEYHLSKTEKQKNHSGFIVNAIFKSITSFLMVRLEIPVNTKRSYFDCSIGNPRAPPQTS